MAKQEAEGEEEVTSLPVNDAWTGMLIVSFLALSIGAGFLAWDWIQYSEQIPPPVKFAIAPPPTLNKGPLKEIPKEEPPKNDDQKKVEPPKNDDQKKDEMKKDEPKKDDEKKDDAKKDDEKKDDAKKDDEKKDDAKKDDEKKDDAKKDDAKKDDAKKDDVKDKKDDAKKDDEKKDDAKKDDAKKDAGFLFERSRSVDRHAERRAELFFRRDSQAEIAITSRFQMQFAV